MAKAYLLRFRSNITWRRVIAFAFLVLLTAGAIRAAYLLIFKGYVWPEWTGFGEFTAPNDRYQRAKTLWDWLGLLVVPAALGIGALIFNQAARDREQRITEDQRKEEALQNYLDKMAELLLKEKLLENKDRLDEPVVNVAQARTVTTLKLLNANRRSILFQFLRDANLADFVLVEASLATADLSNTSIYAINLTNAHLHAADLFRADLFRAKLIRADLREVNLSEANLRATDLSGATLSEADLSRAKLTGSDLSGATLSKADLSRANLSGTALRGAILRGAILRGADLRGANLSEADLSRVILTGALYNDQTKWPDGFDPDVKGAKRSS